MSNMDKLTKNIEETQKKLSTPGFDMNKYVLPDSEVVKKMLKIRNPNMSMDDIELMVDGLGSKKPKSIADMEALSEDANTPFKKKQIDDVVADAKNNLDKTGIPIPPDDFIYEEAKDIKRITIEKSYEFVRKIEELIQDVAFAAIALSQSIPGAIQLIVTPVFPVPSLNVPGMITMLMNVILTLNGLKSKASDAKAIMVYFSKLNIVCSESDAEKVAGILNNFNKTLDTTIFGFTNTVDAFIGSATSAMKSQLDPSKEGKNIKNITKQLRKLKYLPNNNFSKVDEDDIDGVNNILEEWRVVNRTHRNAAVVRKKESQDSLDLATSGLNNLKTAEAINNELKDLANIKTPPANSNELTVYDVEFPDGTILKGLNEDELNGYRNIYNGIYLPNLKFVESVAPNFSLKSSLFK